MDYGLEQKGRRGDVAAAIFGALLCGGAWLLVGLLRIIMWCVR